MEYLNKCKIIKNEDVVRFRPITKHPRFSFIIQDELILFYGRDKRSPLTITNRISTSIYENVISSIQKVKKRIPHGMHFCGYIVEDTFITTHIFKDKKVLNEQTVLKILSIIDLKYQSYLPVPNKLLLNKYIGKSKKTLSKILANSNYDEFLTETVGGYYESIIIQVNNKAYKLSRPYQKTIRYQVTDESSLLLNHFIDWFNLSKQYTVYGDTNEQKTLYLMYFVVTEYIKANDVTYQPSLTQFESDKTKLNIELLQTIYKHVLYNHDKTYQILVGNLMKPKNRLSILVNDEQRDKLILIKNRLNTIISSPHNFMDYAEWKNI